ncbi:MAG: alanyl-tRNA editing protein [Vicinamibacterales bacterium]
MTTERLYYSDAYRTTFEARVVACVARPASTPGAPASYAVELAASAFYPTSGGQPFDTGTLGDARVHDVIDEDEGRVVHVTDRALEPGSVVIGAIDWARRFDHMQQHTGQHVLSAAFDRLFSNRTESFHLGAESCSIDLAREVSVADVARAVDEANRIVWEDRPVSVRFASEQEAAALPLRKEPARGGTLRLIDVADFDLSACGGTHVARTGGIGIIAASGWEKFRGGSRLLFLCGRRVGRRFDLWRDALAATMKHLSLAPEELAGGIERLQGENKALQRALRSAQEKLAGYEARALVERGTRVGDRLVIVEAVPDLDATGLKAMAIATASEPGAAVALFSATSPALAVVARHADANVDAGAVLKALVGRFGGKGGGRPDLAQGGGLQGDAAALATAARELLSR